jgi:hypothetical protein
VRLFNLLAQIRGRLRLAASLFIESEGVLNHSATEKRQCRNEAGGKEEAASCD